MIYWLKAFGDYFTTLCKTRVKEQLIEIVHWINIASVLVVTGRLTQRAPHIGLAGFTQTVSGITRDNLQDLHRIIISGYDEGPKNHAWRFIRHRL